MSSLFPRATPLRQGYRRKQVDEFFANVRTAYEKPVVDPEELTPIEIRQAAFDLRLGGYRTEAVDSALDRLEEAFAHRLRSQFVQARGQDAWNADLAQRAQVLYERLRRPATERFSRPGLIHRGYDAAEVDALMDRITAFFDRGEPITPQEIRTSTFRRRPRRRAYDEGKVDAYFAKAVDILLGVV